jgi:cobalt/nickel transport system ATP-binding protein
VRSGPPAEVFTAPEEMAQVKLRLPHIAELIYRLKNEDGVPFDTIPLTVGEARKQLLTLLPANISPNGRAGGTP